MDVIEAMAICGFVLALPAIVIYIMIALDE